MQRDSLSFFKIIYFWISDCPHRLKIAFLVSCFAFAPMANAENTQAYQHDFAICAIFQNEADYLREWIEFHRLVGAQHFYLYNNRSDDHYLAVLQPYIDAGYVDLIDWSDPDFQASGQQRAYMDAISKAQNKVKWLAAIDIDEYLVPKTHDTVTALLAEYEQAGIGGLGVNRQMFGTSYVHKIGPRQLLTEELTLKAQEDHVENRHIKSIVRPEFVLEPAYTHHFDYKMGYIQINTNREPFTGPLSPEIVIDKIQINHYWTKDENFFYETKIPRWEEWGESMESIEKQVANLNQVKDDSISRFVPTLRQIMFPHHVWDPYHLNNEEGSKELVNDGSRDNKGLWAEDELPRGFNQKASLSMAETIVSNSAEKSFEEMPADLEGISQELENKAATFKKYFYLCSLPLLFAFLYKRRLKNRLAPLHHA